MEARAELRQVRISPRKVGIVLDLIRNKPVEIAFATLKNTPKSACEPLEKLLKSAVANAENNHNMDTSRLYVSEAFVGAGVADRRITDALTEFSRERLTSCWLLKKRNKEENNNGTEG